MPISKPLLYLCLATPAFASTTSAFAHEDRVFEMAEPTERSTRDVIGRYPSWADKEKASAGAILSIVVSPAGKIHRCTITSYVGVAKLATQICNYAQSLRFSPARNIDGDAVHAGLML